ncbi:sensor domain-containing diguanylate cyclase [Alteromonas halophila]|uniref:diguanylate cyclase n=1 Tax=Alteromonas halophila TaxID=516698 RepID=A0A918JNV9_9ALTE|nr:GGDEF domain-containing protein [Alteromonas halophila]GGW93337.1 hypothetical protein GCM10007391_29590 [Alteromonas halophila]
MSNNECEELFNQLPVSLLCKRVDHDDIYANPACLTLFGVSEEFSEFFSSLSFYDIDSRERLAGDEHPFAQCASDTTQRLVVRIKSRARSLNCSVSGRLIKVNGERWVTLHITNIQDNDVTIFQSDNSPLANHLAFSRLLSAISSQLINVSTDHLDSLIERSLGAFGDFCGVDRCYLFQFSDDKRSMSNTHEWVAPGIAPYKDDLQHMDVSDLPYFGKIIKHEHVFKIDNVAHLPDDAALEKQEFERERIQAVLCVAVHINDDLFGFVGCDIIGSPYAWREHDIRYLRLIGEMLSNSLENVANRLSLQTMKSRLEEANQQLAYLANSDGLTGIANRRQFDEHLSGTISRGIRASKPVSLLLIDVDYFKRFNDTLGHLVGDNALKEVARAIDGCCKRCDDLAARYGGEEFAVILAETSAAQAQQVADEVMQAVASLGITFGDSADNVPLTISIGIATAVCCPSLTVSQLITQADKALYQAKAGGRNQVACL